MSCRVITQCYNLFTWSCCRAFSSLAALHLDILQSMLIDCPGHISLQAARSLAELSTPHYHHEFVKRALVMAFEAPASGPALLSLLAHLAGSSQVTLVRASRFLSGLVLDAHAC